MTDAQCRIEALDVRLFDAIPSQTEPAERRSLLAVQRATARRHGRYRYLEIGSHLGGSIQPHLLDARCTSIASIDPRPAQLPDDRIPGYVVGYVDNSSARMLRLLRAIGDGDVGKIRCFEADASEIDPAAIEEPPELIFIDGEHTHPAVLSDFAFCERVVSPAGTIVFHDVTIVFAAVRAICRRLRRERRRFAAVKLEGSVFAIFLDPELVRSDPYLATLSSRNRFFLPAFAIRRAIGRLLPRELRVQVLLLARRVRRSDM